MDNNTYNDDNSCIICLEDTGELLENFFCDCKFKFHAECYKDWLVKSKSRKCMVCFKDYTQETIVDFLANMRTNETSASVPVGQPYDIVPYDSDNISENSDEYEENNRLVTRSSCLLHMPGLLIIGLFIIFIMIIIMIVSML